MCPLYTLRMDEVVNLWKGRFDAISGMIVQMSTLKTIHDKNLTKSISDYPYQ